MRRLLMVLIVVVAVGGAVAYRLQQTQSAATQQDSRLRTATVERGDVVVTVRANGQVEAEQSARLSFEVPGVVAEVLVEEGQWVEEGAVLARLEGEAQRIAVEQAEWSLRVAELNLAALQEPPGEDDLSAAQANVNAAWAAYVDLRDHSVDPDSLRIAELRYEQALAAQADADVVYRDSNGSDLAAAQRGASGFSVEIARLQLEQIRDGPPQSALDAALGQVAQAQAELNRLRAGPTQAELDRAAVAVEQARVQLARAQEHFEDTVLRAPFAGVVTRVNVQEGGLASVGGLPAFEMVDLSRLHVLVEVDEIDIAQVAVGQPVEITLDALAGTVLSGRVAQIAEVAVERGGVISYEVRLDLDETDTPVRVGMTAAVTIIVARVEDVLVVPNLYVRLDRRGGEAFVNVLDEGGTLVERQVVLGAQNESVSAVIGGLQEGDVIAIDLDASGFSIFGDDG